MPSSPMDTPILPPAPTSTHTDPAIFVGFTSTWLKSCCGKAAVATRRRRGRYSLRMAADYRNLRVKIIVGYPWWLRLCLARDVIAITLGRRIYLRKMLEGSSYERL